MDAPPEQVPPPPEASCDIQGCQPQADPDADVALDAEALALCRRLGGALFPWDTTRALELALLKTFCVPSIAGLLDRTGEFAQRPRKRYDDTGLMVAELLRLGPDSDAGGAVIARLNRIHGHYAISNADFIYVLSGFVAEPIRWLQRYGWRSLTDREEQALYRLWRRVGQRMGLAAIPASLEELLAFNQQFEAGQFSAAPANARVAGATLAMLLRDWPAPLRPAIRRLLQALPEATVSVSLGWPQPPAPLQTAVRAALRARSRLANGWQRLFPPRRTRFYSERPTPSYGRSFQLDQLGPPALLPMLNRPRCQGRQRRIGLSGGIASGKSQVGRLLAERSLPLLDADLYARDVLAPGSPASRTVLERYGDRVRGDGGRDGADASLDRAALGRIVFHDEQERRWLEQLVHPLVRARFEAELQRLDAEPAVVLIIPLLFEAGLEALCSEIWLVDCEPGQQLERLMARDGLSPDAAAARLSAQWPLARKRPLADVVLDNRGEAAALPAQVDAALRRGTGAAPAT
ncbi:MAG: dephospho-CoA kinase [Cyanobium sp.]